MRNIFIVAGHSNDPNGDRGTSAFNYFEGDLAIELRDLIINEAKKNNITVKTDSNSNALVQTLRWIRTLVVASDLAIELHFNASAVSTAGGTECIIPRTPSNVEKRLAADLSFNISRILGTRFRGTKREDETPRKKLGWMRIPCENVIVEICFITNPIELAKYIDRKEAVARTILESIRTLS